MDGFVTREERGFLYRVVQQDRRVFHDYTWDGRILVGGQDAVPGAVRLQIVDATDEEGIIYLDRPQVMGLVKALLMTLSEVENGEMVQEDPDGR